jgi:chromate reductase, NAD(P)H dehydrogenase (quinone)
MSVKLLLIAGSARNGAWSVKLRDAARRMADAAGAQTSVLDLRALALPLYDGDVEAGPGVPAGAAALRNAIREHDALLVVTAEYNGFPTPLLINAFDWLSRLPDGLKTTAGKPAALLASSPGALGGLRALNYTRQYLQMAFQMLVVPQQQALSKAHEAFAADGSLLDAKTAAMTDTVVQSLLRLAAQRRVV